MYKLLVQFNFPSLHNTYSLGERCIRHTEWIT